MRLAIHIQFAAQILTVQFRSLFLKLITSFQGHLQIDRFNLQYKFYRLKKYIKIGTVLY